MRQKGFPNGIYYLVIAQSMVAINIVLSKLLLIAVPLMVMLAIRFLMASLSLLLLHECSPGRRVSLFQYFTALQRRDWWYTLAQALCAGFLFNSLMLLGLHYTDANIAGIITSALPAIIALMSWFVLGETVSAQKLLCVFFASLGLLIIAYDKFHGLGYAHSFVGDLLVFLSLLPEAGYYILCKVYTSPLPVFLVSALANGINAILLLPVLLFIPWDPFHITLLNWSMVLLTGLSSGLFYVFWLTGSQQVDGIMASLSTAIMPVMTVLLAWILLGERLTLPEAVGMGLVLLSIVAYARR